MPWGVSAGRHREAIRATVCARRPRTGCPWKALPKERFGSASAIHKRFRGWEAAFNRFRKLFVRYDKLERSFVALNHIAAAIIAFRKGRLTVNIICE